ncbi:MULTISPECIES: hypothetical protein [Pectobacterium]|uniref:hypothetical protein n=1 Tax=Pectobacterium TaxID=122277 RepID=UPI0032EAF187
MSAELIADCFLAVKHAESNCNYAIFTKMAQLIYPNKILQPVIAENVIIKQKN